MEKSIKVIVFFLFFLSQTIIGQTVNPTFDRREVPYCDITKVEQTTSNTTIYFKYTAPSQYANGGWVCAGGNFFIRDVSSNIKYKLIKANNIPICPEKKNFQYKLQVLEFNLVFEALPSTTSKIDIIEDENNAGFNFFGVNLNSPLDSNSSSQQPSNTTDECNNINFIPQTSKPDFQSMLAGVKHAIILETSANGPAITGLEYFLKSLGFETVKYLDDIDGKISMPITGDPYEVVIAQVIFEFNQNYFYNIKMKFTISGTEYSYEFSSDKKIKAAEYSRNDNEFYDVYRSMYGYKKPDFNRYYTVKGAKKITCWTESKLKSFFQSKGCEKIEGIYENSSVTVNTPRYRVGVKKINGIYYLIYISGAKDDNTWDEGEIKATLEPTATQLFYKAKWIMGNKTESDDFYISFENGLFNTISNNEKSLYVKLFPVANENFSNPSDVSSSGTGYAISSDGYIITNHHVIKDANTIKIKGINGDFSKTYSAKVIIEDKNNDLAIIKIDDYQFKSLGKIPYTISSKTSDVGSSVFVLGYPLRASMGDEIKLTNGIVSSKSGFQGDVTSYQITAPVQPGNSGGPLFDSKGNIIGIINAKHIGAENASYAIKSSYILNLIDMMPTSPKLQVVSEVANKPLTEQVKILKKFTYIIEVN